MSEEPKRFGRWLDPNIPKIGWVHISIYDILSLKPNLTPDQYPKCDMCQKAPIRKIHLLENKESGLRYQVGYVCAGYMAEDSERSQELERFLDSQIGKFERLPSRKWIKIKQKKWDRTPPKSYMRINDYIVTIYQDCLGNFVGEISHPKKKFSRKTKKSYKIPLDLVRQAFRLIEYFIVLEKFGIDLYAHQK